MPPDIRSRGAGERAPEGERVGALYRLTRAERIRGGG